jgi:acetylornithine deacetylase
MRAELLDLARELVRQPSVTGDEAAAQRIISERLRDWGLETDVWQPGPDIRNHPAYCDDGLPVARPNLVARWGEATPGQPAALILNGHIDVVPAGHPARWSDDPFAGAVRNGRLYGRGACDMKGGLAACCFAIRTAQKLGVTPRRSVLLQSVIGEETGGLGTLAAILRGYRADAAILAEPTRLELCPLHCGVMSFRILVFGHSAHGALRESGVSAIEMFWPLWQALQDLETRRHLDFRHPLFDGAAKAAPISIGKLQAGDWPSTVPGELIAEGRCGVLPHEECAAVRHEFDSAIHRASQGDDWLRANPPRVEWFEGQTEPGITSEQAAIVRSLHDAHAAITGRAVHLYGAPYGCDLRLFTRHADTPAVVYGPGDIRLAHSVDESVEIEQLEIATEVLAMLVCEMA